MSRVHIFNLFEDLPWTIGAILMVSCFICFTLFGVLLVRRIVDKHALKAHHEVTAVVFANLGVLYSVLLGFTVVNVQQRFDKIKENTLVEASYLVDLYRDAEVFEDNDRDKIRKRLLDYSRSVIDDEWPAMTSGQLNGINAKLSQIWNGYYEIETHNRKQEQWYSVSIDKLNMLMNARLSRLLGSRESLGEEMWVMLVAGAIALATFICFFGLESLTLHLSLATIMAASTGFLLFLIYSLDTAFSGDLSISPEAMESFWRSFQNPDVALSIFKIK